MKNDLHSKMFKQSREETKELLKDFRSRAKKEKRLALLREFAKIKIFDFDQGYNMAQRKRFEEIKAKGRMKRLGKCFICSGKAVHRHHVIRLGYGGSNAGSNIVGLCERCHESVHPHMKGRPRIKSGMYGRSAAKKMRQPWNRAKGGPVTTVRKANNDIV